MASKKMVGVALGTMEYGRYATEEQSIVLTQTFLDAGYTELDTALMYCKGESERIIGRFDLTLRSRLVLHTKVNPWNELPGAVGLSYDSVKRQAEESLRRLQIDSTTSSSSSPLRIDILYLHAPDHQTPLEETLRAMNELYEARVFQRLGLSNYSAELVRDAHRICAQHGWVRPSVYQGMYNCLSRRIEDELFPTLREFGMCFYAYNPLAGGILTGKYTFGAQLSEPGRYHGNDWADRYRERYWKKSVFDAVDVIRAALLKVYGAVDGDPSVPKVSLLDASLRWMRHHSAMSGEHSDVMILGASKLHQLRENLASCAQGPLDARVVQEIERAWTLARDECPTYWR